MENPWHRLPQSSPYLIESDRARIEIFNRSAAPKHRFHPEVLPEPFLGDPGAPIVLLNLNPGFSERDLFTHADPEFHRDSRRNLVHGPADEYPFHLLNPRYRNISEGYGWWTKKLKVPIARWGAKEVSRRFLCVEYFPYHSENWHDRTPRLPSQEYSIHLAREALRRDALVIIMRRRNNWLEAIPELEGQHFELNSQQNVAISPGNMPDEAWKKLEERMA